MSGSSGPMEEDGVNVSASPERASQSNLPCTLFLFNDKLVIVKRQHPGISGKKTTGLDNLTALVNAGGIAGLASGSTAKRDKLSFRGVVDVLEVISADVGGSGPLLPTTSAHDSRR